jgi:polyphenol oxidase
MICLRPHIFADLPQVKAGFFGRQGGVSHGVFESLNCGPGSQDNLDHVMENRARVALFLDIPPVNTLYQIHSPTCVVVDHDLAQKCEADASVTSQKHISLGILTADCGPVLFYGEGDNGAVIGAAHAGWGGAVKGVLESTIDKMIDLGVARSSIRAAIGPCIGWESYEVSRGFETPFLNEDPQSNVFFKEAGEKLKFHLAGYIAFRLRRAGVERVEDVAIDTYADETSWFSYRRSTHRKEPHYGRQISVIALT